MYLVKQSGHWILDNSDVCFPSPQDSLLYTQPTWHFDFLNLSDKPGPFIPIPHGSAYTGTSVRLTTALEIRDGGNKNTGVRQERVIWTFKDIPQSGEWMVGIFATHSRNPRWGQEVAKNRRLSDFSSSVSSGMIAARIAPGFGVYGRFVSPASLSTSMRIVLKPCILLISRSAS